MAAPETTQSPVFRKAMEIAGLTKAKHTPGPWQVTHEDPTQVCDADGEMRGCSPIAYCTVGTRAERKANAKLIAEAPVMFDLLLRLRDTVEALDGTSAENERLVDEYRALVARIEK